MKIELTEKTELDDVQAKVSILDSFVSIPYITEFRKLELVKNINTCLLMARFEELFNQYPEGFYKYKQSCNWQSDLEGLSWREELNMTRTELDTAFNAIVTIYRSKDEYDIAKDKFKGKYYCGFVENQNYNRTLYFRNHKLIDRCCDQLLKERKTK